ncbi:MAG TPA: diguanylate cyclase, partial [Solimonas sp.]|nr:diguanylate cyclase [Solimonas sp.]
ARYGGEEFAMILPQADAAAARQAAERINAAVRAMEIPHEDAVPYSNVTISVGHATVIPHAGSNPIELICEADRALYCAKHAGRDRIIGAE